MPLYEYVCTNGHRIEVMHGVHDTGPTACPTCGAPMRKAFVAPAIVFKGSGWAKVDRRSSGSSSKSSSGGSATSGSTASDSGSSDSSGGSGTSGSSSTSTSTTDSGPTKKSAATD